MPTIYSLVSIDKECTDCQYVNAISYSKELLQNMIQNATFIRSEFRENHTASYPLHNRYYKNGDRPLVILVNKKNKMKLNYNQNEYILNEGDLVLFDDNVMHSWEMENNDMEIYFYRAETNTPVTQGTYCID